MSKFQHNRDNILTPEERAESARKCIRILNESSFDPFSMTQNDRAFFNEQWAQSGNIRYAPSEKQLQWLRDLVDRYGLK